MKFSLGVFLLSSFGILGSMGVEQCSKNTECLGIVSCGSNGTEICMPDVGVCACMKSIDVIVVSAAQLTDASSEGAASLVKRQDFGGGIGGDFGGDLGGGLGGDFGGDFDPYPDGDFEGTDEYVIEGEVCIHFSCPASASSCICIRGSIEI